MSVPCKYRQFWLFCFLIKKGITLKSRLKQWMNWRCGPLLCFSFCGPVSRKYVSRFTVTRGKRAEEWQVLVLDTKSFDKKPACHSHAIFLYVIYMKIRQLMHYETGVFLFRLMYIAFFNWVSGPGSESGQGIRIRIEEGTKLPIKEKK